MKDYDKEKRDARPEAAPQKKLAPKQVDAAGAERPDALQNEHLSHPANAAQLAGILSGLQQSHGNAYVQQVVSGMNEPQPAVETQTSSGQKLDEGVRVEMETAFGENFGDVRVHTGADAERMNEELDARAVTRGRDLYFDRGQYEPSSAEGKELLAHELAHVVQQSGGAAGRQADSVSRPGDAYEEEAHRAARAVLEGERPPVLHRGAAPSYQRQEKGGGQAKQTESGIDLDHSTGGALSGGATYSYDPATRQLTITGQNLTISAPEGGSIVSDSARGAMAPPRTRIVVIRVTGRRLIVTVNGQERRFFRH